MDSPSQKPLKDDVSTIWELLKSITFFLGIYLFFLGWLYLYWYFKSFGLYSGTVKLDVVTYYIFGFFTLLESWQNAVGFFVFLICMYCIYHFRGRFNIVYPWIFGLIILLSVSSYFSTKHFATLNAEEIKTNKLQSRIVYFDFTKSYLESLFKDSTELKLMQNRPALSFMNKTDSIINKRSLDKNAMLLYYNNTMKLRVVFETDNCFYALCYTGQPSTALNIYCIDKKNINYANFSR